MATADIKKFVGYTAIDGSAHDTLKSATDYTRDYKIKEALKSFSAFDSSKAGVTVDSDGDSAVFVEELPEFLFAHREAIMAAFKQDVNMRKPRTLTPKKPKTVVVRDDSGRAGAPAHPGVVDLDEVEYDLS
jgi:hypothetical protein